MPTGIEKLRQSTRTPFMPPADPQSDASRTIVRGDLTLPADSILRGDLIVYGDLHVGKGALVLGSVKVHGHTKLEKDVTILGALIATEKVVCGKRAMIDGPLVSETEIVIGPHSRIGSASSPTSTSAHYIKVYAANTIVHGTLWARDRGISVSL